MEKDPVCGMLIDVKQAAGKRVYKEKLYYFCSSICLARFDKEPERYVTQETKKK